MKPQKIIALIACIFVLVACGPSATSQPTVDVNAIYTSAAITAQAASALATAVPTSPPRPRPPTKGALRGSVNNPMTEGTQTMLVAAYKVSNYPNGGFYSDFLKPGQQNYSIELPGGEYFVIVYVLDGNAKFTGPTGGYTQAVSCGLTSNCTDHSLVPVMVARGKLTPDINPDDFAQTDNAYPFMPGSATTGTAVASPTAVPATCSDSATFLVDVTVPDGTAFITGESFEKIWRLKNTGECMWDTGYFIQYESGPLQPRAKKYLIPAAVAPGQTMDISASFKATLNPGTYRSIWSLRDHDGTMVPVTNSPTNDLYLEIKVEPATAPGSGTYKPVINEVCHTLRLSAQAAIGITFSIAEEPFTDIAGTTGTACTLRTNGSGADFGGQTVRQLGDAIVATLTGWAFDPTYVASGATGELRGYRKDISLVVISVSWQPSPDANCPTDQPIFTCPLTPEQQLFTIVVQAADNWALHP